MCTETATVMFYLRKNPIKQPPPQPNAHRTVAFLFIVIVLRDCDEFFRPVRVNIRLIPPKQSKKIASISTEFLITTHQ